MDLSFGRRKFGVLGLMALTVGLAVVVQPQGAVAAAGADHVLDWNNVLLQAFRDTGGAPGPLARGGAMMHASIWDAYNDITGGAAPAHASYLTRVIPPSPSASPEAAIDHAAHDTLVNAFPAQKPKFDTALTAELAKIPASVTQKQKDDGATVGTAVAQAMIQARSGDGPAFASAYTPAGVPGSWRPTEAGTAAATPHWGSLKPFTMTSPSQFRPAAPEGYATYAALLASPEYATQVNEVKDLGGQNSTTRTASQTRNAWFWANDLDGTYKPPGQLFSATQIISIQQGLDEANNARLFALVSLSMADASVVAWDTKYDTGLDLWRPVSAIQLANQAGNSAIVQDAAWQPLSAKADGTHFTPAFPSYVSGHATFAAAWGGIMKHWFGDTISFRLSTEDPHSAGVTRPYSTISSAVSEDGHSRIFLGVHYRWDTDEGLAEGYNLADYVWANYLH